MAQLQLTGVTSSLKVLVNSSTPTYKLDISGSLAWNNTGINLQNRLGNMVIGRHPYWGVNGPGDYGHISHAALNQSVGTNYCLLQLSDGTTYFNAPLNKLIYFANNGDLKASLNATGLFLGGSTGASYTLDVGGTCQITGDTGIGGAPDAGVRLTVISTAGEPYLAVQTCLGNNSTSTTTYNVLKGYLAIKVNSGVGSGGANIGTGTHYIRLWNNA